MTHIITSSILYNVSPIVLYSIRNTILYINSVLSNFHQLYFVWDTTDHIQYTIMFHKLYFTKRTTIHMQFTSTVKFVLWLRLYFSEMHFTSMKFHHSHCIVSALAPFSQVKCSVSSCCPTSSCESSICMEFVSKVSIMRNKNCWSYRLHELASL